MHGSQGEEGRPSLRQSGVITSTLSVLLRCGFHNRVVTRCRRFACMSGRQLSPERTPPPS